MHADAKADYTANALPNRYYTGLPGGTVIQPTLSPIATSYQPRVSPAGAPDTARTILQAFCSACVTTAQSCHECSIVLAESPCCNFGATGQHLLYRIA